MSERCFFISDLHLLANRSKAHRYLEMIKESAAQANYFILGGDIFDFRWARTRNHAHSVDLAVRWLRELIDPCPNCQFHFVLGNHDFDRGFIDRLVQLESDRKNFYYHRYYARIGSAVFLHGDVADREMHDPYSLAAARDYWLTTKRRGKFFSRLYDVVVATRIHKPIPHLVYAKRVVARRIYAYLLQIEQGPESGVKNVYFGHTHRQMLGYPYAGLIFHNGGAPIKGLKFHIIEADLE